MINVFILGLHDEQCRERVLLKSPETLTEADQNARFVEDATRVFMHNHASSTTTTNPINLRRLSYKDAKHSGGLNQQQIQPRNNGYKGRQWHPGQGPQYALNNTFKSKISALAKTFQSTSGQNKQARHAENGYNCGKLGYCAQTCRSSHKQNEPQQNGHRNNNGNKKNQYANKVSAITENKYASFDKETKEGVVGNTSNNINNVPSCGVNKFLFYEVHKLAVVPRQISTTIKTDKYLMTVINQ